MPIYDQHPNQCCPPPPRTTTKVPASKEAEVEGEERGLIDQPVPQPGKYVLVLFLCLVAFELFYDLVSSASPSRTRQSAVGAVCF